MITTKGSLCSGVGGLDAALPGELAWVCENNDAASLVLKREHAGAANFGDLLTTDWNYRQHHVDLLTSGDPCQSMSAAGRQKASEDERFLWPDVMNVITIIHPEEIFLENVRNLTSVPLLRGAADWRGERGSVLRLRLDDLRAAGYAVRWTVLGACAVGAPHHRHRWFLHARYMGGQAPDAVRVPGTVCGAPRSGGRILLPTPTTRDVKGRNQRDDATCLPGAVAPLPSPTAADGSGGPGRSVKRTGGDNLRTAVALLPTPMADRSGSNRGGAAGREGQPVRPSLDSVAQLLPTPRATDGVNGGPNQRGSSGDLAMGSAVQPEHWGRFAEAVALWEQISGRPAPVPTVSAPKGGRRLNPELSEWMMGYPLGYLTGELSRNDALRCAGNGVVTAQARAAWDRLTETS